MFIKRLLTTCLLIPVVIWVIFYGQGPILTILAALILFGCSWEFQNLLASKKERNLKRSPIKVAWMFSIALMTLLTFWFFSIYWVIGMLIWIYLATALLSFPDSQQSWGHELIVAFFGLILLPLSFVSLVQLYLRSGGKGDFFYLLLIVWASDTGAYLLGKIAGKHKLIPKVSPGKTIEGLLGGLLLPALVATFAYIYYPPTQTPLFIAQWLITVLMCMIGDLTISMFKRRVHCKDTGSILPGHGGLLDRLDSLIAAAPVFYGFQVLLN